MKILSRPRVLTKECIEGPALIVGAGRSGTSVLTAALDHHPQLISAYGEAPHIAYIAGLVHKLEAGERSDYYMSSLAIDRDRFRHGFRTLCVDGALGARDGLRRMVRRAVRERRRVVGIKRWCAKTFPDAMQADGLERLFGDVRFVHIVRSGVDVVHSRTRFPPMKHHSFETHCREWAVSVERYSYLAKRPNAITIRHEHLVDDPGSVFDRILDHLNVPRHPAPAAYASSHLVHPLDEASRFDTDVGQQLRTREVAHASWRPEQLATFHDICGEAMGQLGYALPT